MNRRLFGALGVVAVFTLTVGSCKSDPFSDVHGTPAAVVTNFSYLQLSIGGSANVQASIVDATATPLEIPITFTPCTGDVTVTIDTSYHPVPRTSAQAIVTAVTPAPSCVVVAGGGVKDTVQVAVLPQAFSGAFSSATPKGGDTLTISTDVTGDTPHGPRELVLVLRRERRAAELHGPRMRTRGRDKECRQQREFEDVLQHGDPLFCGGRATCAARGRSPSHATNVVAGGQTWHRGRSLTARCQESVKSEG